MSATAALILVMEAATACGAVAPTGQGAGVEVVQAILDFEPQPSDLSVLTLAAASTDANPETDQLGADPAVEQCRVVLTVIA